MTPRTRSSEAGFTLAGVIVLMTIMLVFLAYTVPPQWSKIMERERDAQTIFVMKQYARAIENFRAKNGSYPVSLDQLRQARTPRLIRGTGPLLDPLTGEDDWILTSAAAVQGQGTTPTPPPGVVNPQAFMPRPPQTPPPPGGRQARPGTPGGAVGPIAGVRPNKSGPSFLALNGAENYEEWQYTAVDLKAEIEGRRAALLTK
jgi:type II secretory pathway pseudopilin PulG